MLKLDAVTVNRNQKQIYNDSNKDLRLTSDLAATQKNFELKVLPNKFEGDFHLIVAFVEFTNHRFWTVQIIGNYSDDHFVLVFFKNSHPAKRPHC